MPDYSIVRVGNEYIVQAGEKSILKISSRRRAVKLVTDAAELLDQQAAQPAGDSASIRRDPDILPGPSELP
ncbi:hypothetical protein JQ615_23660 [Bradyrhizobium jicamae]|uniref:Uncharacterized protein n=1 Tax=Bradyrhizobium jicamae TaxID=280332 RepID=A0ABS5FNP0_9BRAD|nr:hypothetical protein [Bradyrhizobium jicamae]MBR0798388.1 hypothetical protein [Bradyrhizobium jicamae]MBR0936304.1 hypothetical protein [Bradyrhizobium jicamae]